MKKITIIVFLILGLVAIVYSQEQEKFITKHEVGLFWGFNEISKDSMPNGQNLDFMNYLHKDHKWVDYSYIGINASLGFRGGWGIKTCIAFEDSFNPNIMELSLSYLPFKNWGFTTGAVRYSQYLENYNFYHLQSDIGYFGDLNSNFRQIRIHDRGIYLGVLYQIPINQFEFEGELIGGIGSTTPFNEEIHQKLIGGNLRRTYIYEIKNSANFFISPKASFTYNHKTSSGKVLGIGLNMKWLFTTKSINYSRTETLWTNENSDKQNIEGDKHKFNKFDLGLSVKFQW